MNPCSGCGGPLSIPGLIHCFSVTEHEVCGSDVAPDFNERGAGDYCPDCWKKMLSALEDSVQ